MNKINQRSNLRLEYTERYLTIENVLDVDLIVDSVGYNDKIFNLAGGINDFIEIAKKGTIPAQYREQFPLSMADDLDELADYFIHVIYFVNNVKEEAKISIPAYLR